MIIPDPGTEFFPIPGPDSEVKKLNPGSGRLLFIFDYEGDLRTV
jgi:hypothetical protein